MVAVFWQQFADVHVATQYTTTTIRAHINMHIVLTDIHPKHKYMRIACSKRGMYACLTGLR